jgi:hypothetical protein
MAMKPRLCRIVMMLSIVAAVFPLADALTEERDVTASASGSVQGPNRYAAGPRR